MAEPVRYHLGNFPPHELDWPRLVPLIGEANRVVGNFNGLVATIPNADVLLSPLTVQEAVLSSKIEGTNVSLSEVLEIDVTGGSDVPEAKRQDAIEVLNYRRAIKLAADTMQEQPLSQHLIREIHYELMQGVRGQNKTPGAYRTIQNWIGKPGCNLDNATFIPIPPEYLAAGLDQWITYLQDSSCGLDPLVQLAVIHAEFEALHPFLDGNGRLGRILIPLFMYEHKLLSRPNFYISEYLEAHRDEYISSLREVSRNGVWSDWCIFFLQAIIEQGTVNQNKAQSIVDLYQSMGHRITCATRSRYSTTVRDFLFSHPVFSGAIFAKQSGIPVSTASRILDRLCKDKILNSMSEARARRTGIYKFPKLLDIVE